MAALLRGNRTYIYVCEPFERIVSSSILYGGDVSKSSFSLLLLQISLTNIIASILKVALEPFIILSFVPEMLVSDLDKFVVTLVDPRDTHWYTF